MQAPKLRWMGRAWVKAPKLTRTYILPCWVATCWLGPLALGCYAAPIDVGTDFTLEVSPESNPGAKIPDEDEAEDPANLQPLVDRAVSAACSTGFEACGGVLAGRWIMEDTCNNETRNPKALQIWGQTFMNLDTAACWDAVESVTTRWTGMLRFERGEALDQRLRADTIAMNLTRNCLNATFDSNIREERMSAICTALTNDMTNCSSVGGVCHCSNRRESEIDTRGTYGVLGKSVAIGKEDDTLDFFDYCVDGNRLLWREASSKRHQVLRREGTIIPGSFDPEIPR
jgi:hypothetical protein